MIICVIAYFINTDCITRHVTVVFTTFCDGDMSEPDWFAHLTGYRPDYVTNALLNGWYEESPNEYLIRIAGEEYMEKLLKGAVDDAVQECGDRGVYKECFGLDLSTNVVFFVAALRKFMFDILEEEVEILRSVLEDEPLRLRLHCEKEISDADLYLRVAMTITFDPEEFPAWARFNGKLVWSCRLPLDKETEWEKETNCYLAGTITN